MEGKLANTWQLTVNEKKFIETALLSELRTDGRGLYDYRKLTIKFGREPGSSEVQLGHTHVLGFVTAQLVQPYRDRPNEGSISIFTEFSPMADPSFEPGRPGESAVELGRIIDRGLRESRAVDTESLCILAGKFVWAVRIDLHILDNAGNLVDAANLAALAALLTFQRPECSLGGDDKQEVIIHPPEEREPLPLILHHLPIAFTFGFFIKGSIVAMDPTHLEEAVMCGRMTVTVNANGDICAIQKGGGEGVMQSVIFQCLRLASERASATAEIIKKAVETDTVERALKKIKRHPIPGASVNYSGPTVVRETQSVDMKDVNELSRKRVERLTLDTEECCVTQSDDVKSKTKSSKLGLTDAGNASAGNFSGGPSSWDPYSKGVDTDTLKASLASRVVSSQSKLLKEDEPEEAQAHEDTEDMMNVDSPVVDASKSALPTNGEKTLKDAVKRKNKKKKRASKA